MIVPARPMSGNRLPRVAVVVPCYNYSRYLPQCVGSVLSQPGVETQVHIIDDASTDDSFRVARHLADAHAGVSVTRHATNAGHIATYNEGLERVESDYVVLLSADDQLAPGALARATALMEAFPSVGLVYGHPRTFRSEPDARSVRVRNWSVWTGTKWIDAQFARGMSIIYSPEAVVRTAVHREAGYYSSSLPHSGDLELWLRIAAVADVGRVNGPDQAYRRLHSESMMESTFKGVVTDLRERFRAYESFLATSGLDAGRRRRLEEIARQRASAEALLWASSPGAAHSAEARSAVQFAESVYADFRRLRAYRFYEASRKPASGLGKARLAAMRLPLEMGARAAWRRWRRYGV